MIALNLLALIRDACASLDGISIRFNKLTARELSHLSTSAICNIFDLNPDFEKRELTSFSNDGEFWGVCAISDLN